MFFYDGKFQPTDFISLNIYDSSWLYGATVFTTLRIYDNSLFHPLTNWYSHLDRLKLSINEFNWSMPNWERIEKEAKILLPHFPILRITIFPDGKELIIGRKFPPNLAEKQEKGVKGLVINNQQIQRSLPLHKTGNYLIPWLALQQAQKNGYDEAILTNINGDWLETTTGNLWGYKNGIWFTPTLETGILPGIARKMIIEKADFPVQINTWTKNFCLQLDSIGYSNSVVEIIPFNSIKIDEKLKIFNPDNPSFLLLKNIYRKIRFS